MAKDHKRLGEILIEAKLLTPEQVSDAIAEQKRTGQMLGATLIKMGLVTEEQLLEQLQRQLNLPLINLADASPDEEALSKIKEEMAKKYCALPVEMDGRTLVVAMSDPMNVAALEDLRFHSGMFIRPVLASPSQIYEAIDRFFHIDKSMNEVVENIISTENEIVFNKVTEDETVDAIENLKKEVEGRPIVRLTNWMLTRAIEARASDIHIEPQERELVVRMRIDGLLQEIQRLPKWTQSALVSRIKVLSQLDIAEKRVPQDGRMMIDFSGRRIDMRVSTLPITNGEKVVIRVTDQSRGIAQLESLGFQDDDITKLKSHLSRPQGIILVTGPTGSGKSTLLYGALRHVQHVSRNIVTVEDPVEVQIKGINQVQVEEKQKKTFPAALRAILRQDPDVIMIGEIRDKETAQIAFRASITGHLVLTTIHTNDAASAVTRLIDLGLEPFMVASALVSVCSIRLPRTLCLKCKEPYEADQTQIDRLTGSMRTEREIKLFRGKGCPACNNTGYSGRTGIFEVLEVTDPIRKLITQNATDSTIRHAAIEGGMRTIGEDGLQKALMGKTTVDEVARVVYLAEQGVKLCPTCQCVLMKEYEYCPSCGEFVGEHCEHCHHRLDPGWTFCPYCGNDAKEGQQKHSSARRKEALHLEEENAQKKLRKAS